MHFGLFTEHYQPRCFAFSCSVTVLLLRNWTELYCGATWALVYKISNLVALMNFVPIFSLQLLFVGLFCSVSQLKYSTFFQAHIKFPIDYPYSPPTFRFLTKMWHPNIYEVRCFFNNFFWSVRTFCFLKPSTCMDYFQRVVKAMDSQQLDHNRTTQQVQKRSDSMQRQLVQYHPVPQKAEDLFQFKT